VYTSAAQALRTSWTDYEEGTWTPTLTGATSGSITGFTVSVAAYTKVGNLVTVACYLTNINVSASTISGAVQIDNLPFTSLNYNDLSNIKYTNLFTDDESAIQPSGYATGNRFVMHRGASRSQMTNSHLDSSITAGTIMFGLTYRAA